MQSLNLAGSWNIRSTDGHYDLAATVPGSLFAELEARGDFGAEGLFWRENNRLALPVADHDFIYSRDFGCDASWFQPGQSVFLEADGLDTLASISLNGAPVATSRNMHRRYRWELGPLLIQGSNHLEIHFANSLEYCRTQRQKRNLWHSYDKSPDIVYAGFNTIRKSHCSYGWDWGPIIPDVGIWRDIRLTACTGVILSEPRVLQTHHQIAGKTVVDLEITAECQRLDAEPIDFVAKLTSPQGQTQSIQLDDQGHGTLRVEDPELWWPNGMGRQPLYSLELSALRAGDVLQNRSLSLGLRTLTVRREPDQWGESFEFVANGIPFFACGADWIPEDVALARVSRSRTERLIVDAVRANFNCLRVWGGGVYPSDDFYDLCDRYGLVVWQDMMFACALYDIRDPEFRSELEAEVRDNLRRIRHHASLGLICGNNEMEWGFVDWDFPKPPETKTDYLVQYQVMIPAIHQEVCPELFYWPASPSSGGDFDQPNSPDKGDCHFWDVWHHNKDYTEYTKHYFRFMSEFGFESFPDLKTIESFTLPQDRNVFSPVMDDHQRCLGGNAKILNYAAKYFRFPKNFEYSVYQSQISQAEAQRAGIEHWRRNRGRCMGSVYWQLNDNWPVASWSSIDSAGRWKLLHYAVKKAYAPQLLSSHLQDVPTVTFDERQGLSLPATNGHFEVKPALVQIHLSNESARPIQGSLEWRLIDWSGQTLRSGQTKLSSPAWASRLQVELDLRDVIQGPEVPRNCVLVYRASLADGQVLDGWQTFIPFKMLNLHTATISIEVQRNGQGRTFLAVRSDRPALFVTIDHRDYDLILADNGFFLDGQTVRLVEIIEARQGEAILPVQSLDLVGELRAKSLVDSYSSEV